MKTYGAEDHDAERQRLLRLTRDGIPKADTLSEPEDECASALPPGGDEYMTTPRDATDLDDDRSSS